MIMFLCITFINLIIYKCTFTILFHYIIIQQFKNINILLKIMKIGIGLINLGNTCFLNSCMQALSHTYELSEFLSSKKFESHLKPDIPDSIITKEWNDLREIMWKNNGTVSPNRYVYYVQQIAGSKGRDLFTGWAQNDMPEFLLFMIECIHNSVSRPISMKITGKINTSQPPSQGA